MTQDCREKSPSSDGGLIIKIPKRDLLFYVEIRVPDFSSYYCAVFGVCVCVCGGGVTAPLQGSVSSSIKWTY